MISFTTLAWRLVLLTAACGYCGEDPITMLANVPQDFMDGYRGQPVQMRYRPDWQNWGNF